MAKTPKKPNQDDLTFSLNKNLNFQRQENILQMIRRKSEEASAEAPAIGTMRTEKGTFNYTKTPNIFPKQVWPYQHGDEIETAKHINPTQYKNSKLKEWDPDLLKIENNERAKNIPIEDIIAMTCDWYYNTIRGLYENNEDMSIFKAIVDTDGIAACNYESSFPALILDACEAPIVEEPEK